MRPLVLDYLKPASLANSRRQKENIKLNKQDNITNSLAHSQWNCKYHVVFAPKYRRKIFYNEKRADIREILKTLCAWYKSQYKKGQIVAVKTPHFCEYLICL